MKLQIQKRFTAETDQCPRCSGEHKGADQLLFTPLSNPQDGEGDLFAWCLESNEPILISSSQA